MTPHVFASVDWNISAERHKGMAEVDYQMQCRTCGAASGNKPDRASGKCWAMVHTGDNPAHRQYVQLARTFWRATPGPSNPEWQGGT
ncbi:hypothetical protein HUT18_28480 [Streptomyces sp. NA04227]|uniref:DUF7848 domain-containing protein n=1 Tax=Streptomyces sp. NA04227 TaxID=2742136 RepID=UPI0015906D95|nr:hypothetical protein [Streptomyces sp. NA04227]QKW09759.1 hypothetical protein HUT18_28480 [Streptomyces sp. NA04227]